ncbi:tail fiber assembly protein [Enterobacter sp. JMULE2]|uniref:tail fiber assembly protein n=1 Tax=Enterobacter sp. JMULE2 TaxID=2518340 RepID=UPI001575D73A|nr:tail fiber assembly protein [Enterobacter sp. JMULE2]NTZ37822.1 tail fiber assembly protein [Enterobacter sp. JMULE2]NTZ41496.1 tail fiber assembly protein [Enterobacter sp. JMULE2]
MKKYFSNSESSFYVEETVIAYRDNEIPLPPDLFEITEEEYQSFMVSPHGMTPHYNIKNKAMEWAAVALPEPDYVDEAEKLKARLMRDAEAIIAPLQRAVKYAIATESEKQMLEQWEVYTVLLSRVDTSLAPDVEWPPVPV